MAVKIAFFIQAALATMTFVLLFVFVKGLIVERVRRRRQCATRRLYLRFDDTHEAHSASCLRY